MLLALIQAGVAVYSPHTSFDNTPGGINDLLAGLTGLQAVAPLRQHDGTRQCKVVVFVPESDLSRVADALFAAGAGQIGQYSQCSFRLAGTGTFFGSDACKPTVGQKGRREEVDEWRLEAVCPETRVEQVIRAMRTAHSYEEPAYDVYPLRPLARPAGDGRIGQLPRPMSLIDLAQVIKKGLRADRVQVVGDPGRSLERMAIVCGAGGEFLGDAIRAGADVLLTGELRFHDYLAALANGLNLLLPGHYKTERFGIEELALRMHKEWPDLHIWASQRECDPVQYV
jgi:dinuclear metal center YbgI/SA1388 family protein